MSFSPICASFSAMAGPTPFKLRRGALREDEGRLTAQAGRSGVAQSAVAEKSVFGFHDGFNLNTHALGQF